MLCPRYCHLERNHTGKCSVRTNLEGRLWSMVYSRPMLRYVDRVEKTPLFHFHPGSIGFFTGTWGNNLYHRLLHGPNHMGSPTRKQSLSPKIGPVELVQEAVGFDCANIIYTCSEPAVSWEYTLDTAREAKRHQLRNIMVTNGYMTPPALNQAVSVMHAARFNLWAGTEEFYANFFRASLSPVLESLSTLREQNIWVEVTTLLTPGVNDKKRELEAIASFLAETDRETPWHIAKQSQSSQGKPGNKKVLSDKLFLARKIGLEAGLKHIHLADTGWSV